LDNETKVLHNRLKIIAGQLGYVNWQFTVFGPIKTMTEEEKPSFYTLSGFRDENDLYTFGNILISMCNKLKEEGYIKVKEEKYNAI
jgi:hypothetical protein